MRVLLAEMALQTALPHEARWTARLGTQEGLICSAAARLGDKVGEVLVLGVFLLDMDLQVALAAEKMRNLNREAIIAENGRLVGTIVDVLAVAQEKDRMHLGDVRETEKGRKSEGAT